MYNYKHAYASGALDIREIRLMEIPMEKVVSIFHSSKDETSFAQNLLAEKSLDRNAM